MSKDLANNSSGSGGKSLYNVSDGGSVDDALSVLEANKIAKFEHRLHLFHSDFVPLALETYGGTSGKFDKLIEKATIF